MRPLEILAPLALAIYILWPLTGKNRPSSVGLLPAFAMIIISTHAQVEGMRWQMMPLYIFTAIAVLISIPVFIRTAKNQAPIERPLRILLTLGLLALAMALPLLLPVPAIPNPSGTYQVGTRTYELTDSSRGELYSGKDEVRRFSIQVWYPAKADPTTDKRAPWMENSNVYAPTISTYLDLPTFFLNHLALVKVPAFKDVPVTSSEHGFPIILFSHGWNGFNAQNTGQALQLASHGYVVVGVQHTYGAVVTVFEDGTVAKNNPSALPEGAPNDEYETAAQKLVSQWAGDLAFALDFIEKQNNDVDSPFYNTLDPSREGAYGHSTGGGAVIQFCGTDTRCKAVLGMDPFMRPVSSEVIKSGVIQPSLYLFSQVWADDVDSRNNKLFNHFYANSKETYGALYIEGTDHYDFSDLPLLSPLAPQLGLKGPINGRRVTVIINDYLLSFFDMTLNDGPSNLFDNPSPYPEVKPKP